MAPFIGEVNSLGEAHKKFNSKVDEVLNSGKRFHEIKQEYGGSDLDELLKVEIAAKSKNVDYIIEVLKSNDMLHVSRAIKKSTWLITDDQYSNIINPEYLHSELFLHMQNKAICKLLLHIRLYLRNEKRVDEFYNYYELRDVDKALKWLPNCCLDVILQATKKYSRKFSAELLKRLCRRSFAVFENSELESNRDMYQKPYFKELLFLLRVEPDKYLEVIEKSYIYNWPVFGKKYTTIIMNKCPQRVLNKFDLYCHHIDMETLGKYIGSQNIKQFIIDQVKKNSKFMLQYKNIKPLIKLMPKEDKFEFLKSFFINKKRDDEQIEKLADVQFSCGSSATPIKRKMQCYSMRNPSCLEHIYQWYRHAPFEIAFGELKKLIRAESSPEERGAIFRVLLTSAGKNINNISTLLLYYIERHINEPFKYKVHFVNAVLSTTNTHEYDEETWKMLQDLFHSMEVYTNTNYNVQNCVDAILVYHIVHKQAIPEVIKNKFVFTTLNKVQNKLSIEAKELVFNYLYNYLEERLKKQDVKTLEDWHAVLGCLGEVSALLSDWNKDLNNFPYIIDKTKELIRVKKEKQFDVSLEHIYYKNKMWSKCFFEESLLMSQEQKVCVNIIKHDVRVLEKCEDELNAMRCDDNLNLQYFLTKIRVYWPDSVSQTWSESYKNRVDQSDGQRALVRGLCALLPREELLAFFRKYAPDDTKINWSEIDKNLLALRKSCAKLMYYARPQPPPPCVLEYARGDYLQFALPSLISIFHNISSHESREHLPKLLNNVVSLKKHGIRLAISKLNSDELKDVLLSNWESSKNSSIRAVIFKETFYMLCREKNAKRIGDVWSLLQHLIKNLTTEENKDIYILLGNVSKLPEVVQPQFCVISYKLLKSLPAKMNCESIADSVCVYTAGIMDRMDAEFIENLLLEFLNDWYVNKKVLEGFDYGFSYNMLDVISAYVLMSKDGTEQMRRFDKTYKVLLDHLMEMWKSECESQRLVEVYFANSLNNLLTTMKDGIIKEKCVVPVGVFKRISETVQAKLSSVEDYQMITLTKFLALYAECCALHSNNVEAFKVNKNSNGDNDDYSEFWDAINADFAKSSIQLLREDIETFFPSISVLFKDSLKHFYNSISSVQRNDADFAKAMMEGHDFIPAYIAAMGVCESLCKQQPEDPVHSERVAKVRKMILAHPSKEVIVHYHKKLNW